MDVSFILNATESRKISDESAALRYRNALRKVDLEIKTAREEGKTKIVAGSLGISSKHLMEMKRVFEAKGYEVAPNLATNCLSISW